MYLTNMTWKSVQLFSGCAWPVYVGLVSTGCTRTKLSYLSTLRGWIGLRRGDLHSGPHHAAELRGRIRGANVPR